METSKKKYALKIAVDIYNTQIITITLPDYLFVVLRFKTAELLS